MTTAMHWSRRWESTWPTWLPTERRYLGSVSKAKALEAVKEATGVDPAQATAGMKKGDLVAYCASKLEATRWLPAPLRSMPATQASASEAD
jgi:ParB family chromosome partitioning protein